MPGANDDDDLDEPVGEVMTLEEAPVGSLEHSLGLALNGKPGKGGGKSDAKAGADGEDDDFDPREALRPHQPTTAEAGDDEDEDEDLDDEEEEDLDDEDDDEEEEEAERKNKPTAEDNVDVFAELESLGLGDLKQKYGTPKKAFAGLVEAARMVGRKNEAADYWNQLVSDENFQRQAYEKLRAKFGGAEKTGDDGTGGKEKSDAAAEAPKPPEWRSEWSAFIEGGKIKEGTDPELAKKIRAAADDRRLLQEDPVAYFDKYYRPRLEKQWAEQFGKRDEQAKKDRESQETQARLNDYTNQLLAPHAKWLFVEGDWRKGKSRGGEVFDRYLEEVSTLKSPFGGPRYPDPQDRIEYALAKTRAYFESLQKPADAKKPGKKDKRGRREDRRLAKAAGASRRLGRDRDAGGTGDLEKDLRNALRKGRGG